MSLNHNITALNLCESVLGGSTDPAAIKFMKLAPSLFPQFIKPSHGNATHPIPNPSPSPSTHSHRPHSLNTVDGDHDINALIPVPPSDSDTTQSMDTVYSQDDIKAAQQLLDMHSFATINSKDSKPAVSLTASLTVDSVPSHHHHCFILDELDCIDDAFHVHSQSMTRLDRLVRSGRITVNSVESAMKSKCRRCGKRFASRLLLSEHLQRVHDLYFCVKCQAMYASQRELADHKCKCSKRRRAVMVDDGSGERPFRCNICLKTFVSKGNWKRHSLVHNGQRRFHCKFCGKGYIQQWRHRKHEQQCGA